MAIALLGLQYCLYPKTGLAPRRLRGEARSTIEGGRLPSVAARRRGGCARGGRRRRPSLAPSRDEPIDPEEGATRPLASGTPAAPASATAKRKAGRALR